MRYLYDQLSKEIRNKYGLLKSSSSVELISKFQKMVAKTIEKNSQIHSYRIEHPNTQIPFSISRNNRKRDIKKDIHNIEEAFRWGVKNFNPYLFDESFIREIAGKITPNLYEGNIAQYRENGTSITGATTTPPYPFKLINYEIPEFISSLNKQLKGTDIINKIETAIFAHLHLVRLHPFVDGNGRAARTLQNIILSHGGIPVPLIEAGERHLYYQCLDKSISDWNVKKGLGINHGPSEGEILFYTLIASKINTSLDKILRMGLIKNGKA